LVKALGTSQTVQVLTYTAPSGPPSINNDENALESANIVIADLEHRLLDYDAFLVACYSVHPLVPMLRRRVRPDVYVTGIFEASIAAALSMLSRPDFESSGHDRQKFGIVTTGTYWESALSEGVMRFLGVEGLKDYCERFKGVESTGLNAAELHTAGAELVERRMKEATKSLVRDRDVSVICLGCAGMAGMDKIVEKALIEELGEDAAAHVYIIDGVKAGISSFEGLVKAMSDGRRTR